MKTVAIVQARLGSTRLPGKVLADIGGRTTLERVLDRIHRCSRVDEIIVATSLLDRDDAVAAEAKRLGVKVYQGSEDDVLERFRGAARAMDATVCIRFTADCPLIDPGVSDGIIEAFFADPALDYVSNKIPQSFPRGLDTEVFSRAVLEIAADEAVEEYERVHVTPYFYRNPDRFRVLGIVSEVNRADWRWTLDTPDDLEFIRAIYSRLSDKPDFTWLDVVSIIDREPALAGINAHVQQKSIEQG
ncbi:MAG: glycosyltransferase family protein [Gemmatimonadaceae bacterium]